MSRAQKIALALSGGLLLVLGAALAVSLAGGDGDSAAPPGSSLPSPSSAPSSAPEPVRVRFIELATGASNGGGWGTSITFVFEGDSAPRPAAVKAGGGSWQVTFDQPVVIPPQALRKVADDFDRLLLKPDWDESGQVLSLGVEAFAGEVSRSVTGSDVNRATVELVRTPSPVISNDCIQIDDPPPFTKLYGLTTVSGEAELFEAGPMTVVARAPGAGQTSQKVKTSQGSVRVPFQTEISLPLLDAPSEGYIAAFDHSAKDGSPICTVKVPVYMSPGDSGEG